MCTGVVPVRNLINVRDFPSGYCVMSYGLDRRPFASLFHVHNFILFFVFHCCD